MAVYVDDMYKYPIGQFGRMKMSHMVASTKGELLEMAKKIGVDWRWIQFPEDPHRIHFDIAMSKRRLAIKYGAIEVPYLKLNDYFPCDILK